MKVFFVLFSLLVSMTSLALAAENEINMPTANDNAQSVEAPAIDTSTLSPEELSRLRYACYARDYRGFVFRASGRSPSYRVQNDALWQCYRYSGYGCYISHCGWELNF